jgi:hypothetical protein
MYTNLILSSASDRSKKFSGINRSIVGKSFSGLTYKYIQNFSTKISNASNFFNENITKALKCLYHGFGVCLSRKFRVF